MADMVSKALRLLSMLGDYPDGVALSDLSRATGFPVSTTHRLLSSLQEQGFVRSDPASKRYALGLRLFELGQQVSHARGFAGVALPVMHEVSERTGEPTLMAVLDGHHQVYVHAVRGRQQVQIRGEPGRRGPVHCTSMGKCLIAFAPAEVRARLVAEVELAGLAPGTITDRAAFEAEIDRVRERGSPSPTRSTSQGSGRSGCRSPGRTGSRSPRCPPPRPPTGCPWESWRSSCRCCGKPRANWPRCCRAESTMDLVDTVDSGAVRAFPFPEGDLRGI